MKMRQRWRYGARRAAPLSLRLVTARRHAAPRARAILRAVVIGEAAGVLTAGAQARPRAEQLRFVDDGQQRRDRALVLRAAAPIRDSDRRPELSRVVARKGRSRSQAAGDVALAVVGEEQIPQGSRGRRARAPGDARRVTGARPWLRNQARPALPYRARRGRWADRRCFQSGA